MTPGQDWTARVRARSTRQAPVRGVFAFDARLRRCGRLPAAAAFARRASVFHRTAFAVVAARAIRRRGPKRGVRRVADVARLRRPTSTVRKTAATDEARTRIDVAALRCFIATQTSGAARAVAAHARARVTAVRQRAVQAVIAGRAINDCLRLALSVRRIARDHLTRSGRRVVAHHSARRVSHAISVITDQPPEAAVLVLRGAIIIDPASGLAAERAANASALCRAGAPRTGPTGRRRSSAVGSTGCARSATCGGTAAATPASCRGTR